MLSSFRKCGLFPLALFLYGALCSANVLAVDCDLGAPPSLLYEFSSQAQLDAFPQNCDTVAGRSLLIGYSDLATGGGTIADAETIVDLSPLANLIAVNTTLLIAHTKVSNLDALSNLSTLRDNLVVQNNSELTSVEGLSKLNDISILSLIGNRKLLSLEGLHNVSSVTEMTLSYNNHVTETSVGLTDLRGLRGLTGNLNKLRLDSNMALVSLEGLEGITHIGNLTLLGNGRLENVDGLAGLEGTAGNIQFLNMGSLTNIDGFSGLTAINGTLSILLARNLTNLDGLSGIATASTISISNNEKLASCTGLARVLGWPTIPHDPNTDGVTNFNFVDNALIDNVDECLTGAGHTIGGQVSGLTGTGLILQNNDADDLNILTNGSFQFDTSLLAQSPYEITVKTQPTSPSQVCTVSNGEGTAPNAAITNVSVQCVTQQFTVSGTVTGLNGTGLRLQNNGTDEQLITTNGAFSFSPQVDESSYSITIATQPNTPLQSCTVTQESGTLAGANVTNVQVACADLMRSYTAPLPSGGNATLSFNSVDSGCTFSPDPQFLDANSISPAAPNNLQFPLGVAAFTVIGCANGAQLDITLDYEETLPSNATVWKTDPWRQLTTATLNTTMISYSIIDGGPNDADGVENGIIVDPVGVAVPSAGPVAVAIAVPTLPLWALGMLISLFGCYGMRRFRK